LAAIAAKGESLKSPLDQKSKYLNKFAP